MQRQQGASHRTWWNDEATEPAPSESNPNHGTARVAAAAANHRLANVESLVDLQAVASALGDMLPYLMLFSGLFLYMCFKEISTLLMMTATVWRVNRKMRLHVAKKELLQASSMVHLVSAIAVSAASAVILLDCSFAWRAMFLSPPRKAPQTITSALFQVLTTDTLARMLWSGPKLLLVTCSPYISGSKLSPAAATRAQGRLLSMAEHTFMLYRTIVPAHIWYSYLVHCCPSHLLCSLLAGLYLALKVMDVRHFGSLCIQAVALAMRRGSSWGSYVESTLPASNSDQQSGASNDGLQRQEHRQTALSLVISAIAASSPAELQPIVSTARPASQQAEAAAEAHLDMEAGTSSAQEGICPICHDALVSAVELPCSHRHTFCEDCICEWLERHRTCPLCRAEVKPAGLGVSDGSTSLLPVLF